MGVGSEGPGGDLSPFTSPGSSAGCSQLLHKVIIPRGHRPRSLVTGPLWGPCDLEGPPRLCTQGTWAQTNSVWSAVLPDSRGVCPPETGSRSLL